MANTGAPELGALPQGFENFPEVWRDKCAPQLRTLESARKQAVMILGVGVAALVATVIATLVTSGLILGILLVIALVALIWGGVSIAGVNKKAKAAMMAPMCLALDLRHKAAGFSPPALEELKHYKLLPANYDIAKFEDLIEGAADGQEFALCEVLLQDRQRVSDGKGGKEHRTVTLFRGLVGRLAHPARVTSETVLTRDFGIFNKLQAPRGMKRAGLGDPTFEKKFELFTTDQVEARYLVTPVVMEQLLALETQFKGKNIRAAFADGALYFALESNDLFEAGSPFQPYDNPKRMMRLVNELAAVRGLVLSLRALKTGS